MSKHMDAELDGLLATLATILDSVGVPGAAEAETKARADDAAAFASDAWFLTRTKLVRKAEAVATLIEDYDALTSAAASATSAQAHDTSVIKSQATVRKGLLDARGLWVELDRFYQIETRKRRSKFSADELRMRGEATAMLLEYLDGMQAAVSGLRAW